MAAIALRGGRGRVRYDWLVGSDDGNFDPSWDIVAAESVDGLRAGANDLD
jgi:hypothetical protein